MESRATAVVTGAGRGLGLALARQFLDSGCSVVVAATRREPPAVLREMAEQDERLLLCRLDVASPASISEFRQTLARQVRHLDVLVNNAGIPPETESLLDLPMGVVRTHLETHALGPLGLVRELKGLLRAGSVVANISSVVAGMRRMDSRYSAYAPSKALQNAFTRALADTLAPAGVVVLAVSPGWVATDMGGPNAPTSPAESAAGIVRQVMSATIRDTGLFLDYRGEPVDW